MCWRFFLYFSYQITETPYSNKLEYLLGSPTRRRGSLKSGATRSVPFFPERDLQVVRPPCWRAELKQRWVGGRRILPKRLLRYA